MHCYCDFTDNFPHSLGTFKMIRCCRLQYYSSQFSTWKISIVGHLLQNLTMYICMQQSTLIQLHHRISSFTNYNYSFNFNNGYFQHGYFCARRILILFHFNTQSYILWNEYIYSTSTKIFSFNYTHLFSSSQVPRHR